MDWRSALEAWSTNSVWAGEFLGPFGMVEMAERLWSGLASGVLLNLDPVQRRGLWR